MNPNRTAVAVFGLILCLAATPARAAQVPGQALTAGGLADVPVSFGVRNVNSSKVPCATDGDSYQVRGHLTMPVSMLAGGRLPAVTVYMQGGTLSGDAFWRIGVEGFNFAHDMARRGHATLVVDRLGWGASDIPNGSLICHGGHADVLHQIVARLRSGDYEAAGFEEPPAFARVALAGHSGGGVIAGITAYSFPDVLDALVIMSSAFEQGFPAETVAAIAPAAAEFGATCARGGEDKWSDQPLGGYAWLVRGVPREVFVFDAREDVVDWMFERVEKDSCGEAASTAVAQPFDRELLRSITIPVLLLFGREDRLFPPAYAEAQRDLFRDSDDVELIFIDDAGHALPAENAAPQFRDTLAEWLESHGL